LSFLIILPDCKNFISHLKISETEHRKASFRSKGHIKQLQKPGKIPINNINSSLMVDAALNVIPFKNFKLEMKFLQDANS
jgi:hypothetical protein